MTGERGAFLVTLNLGFAMACEPSATHPPKTPAGNDSAAAATVPDSVRASSSEPKREVDLVGRIQNSPASPCVESPLPKQYRGSRAPLQDNLGRGLALSLPPSAVTAGKVGDREVAVYRSFALDPRSELGDAGYRVTIRNEAGTVEDLSLGTSEMRPYVIFSSPRLPLLDGDVLQLGADVRELDDSSVTFPPVALQARREAHNLLLRCDLAELRKDSDADGLTDLEEARLVTDPKDPDSDHDGVPDGSDLAPIGGQQPTTPADEVRAAALVQIVEKEMRGELLIEKTTGPRLDLKGVTFRMIALRPAEFEAYEKRFGMRVTFELKVELRDHGTVSVSYGWAGGGYKATRTAHGWTFAQDEAWVT